MLTQRTDGPPSTSSRIAGLARSCHPGPSAAVTMLSVAFAIASGLTTARLVLVALAVLTGQLSIGWANDLIDVDRDRAVGRSDKPLANGDVVLGTARVACGLALLATVVLSLACGPVAGLIHLGCVAAGWSYNLGVKSTVLSWVPYAVAFAGLPVFITLAPPGAGPPPWWVPTAGALLGVGAHLLNVLPDLDDDAATGVRGLAHRLGHRSASVLAVICLVSASVLLAVGAQDESLLTSAAALVVVALLAVLALRGHGKIPFRAAIGIALADVILLVVSG
ncbi:UbiA family prenyltransferase [Knoellia sp. CPCC 206453]|uniref:UbiA family prenyltransferase n=1 Tax=Knoellia pratensis TaxID=3404796 RepID=UPI00360D79DC